MEEKERTQSPLCRALMMILFFHKQSAPVHCLGVTSQVQNPRRSSKMVLTLPEFNQDLRLSSSRRWRSACRNSRMTDEARGFGLMEHLEAANIQRWRPDNLHKRTGKRAGAMRVRVPYDAFGTLLHFCIAVEGAMSCQQSTCCERTMSSILRQCCLDRRMYHSSICHRPTFVTISACSARPGHGCDDRESEDGWRQADAVKMA